MQHSVHVKFHSEALLEELEARQLFSGGIEGILADNNEPETAVHMEVCTEPELIDNPNSIAINVAEIISQELVFIDSDVDNYQQLLNDIISQSDEDRNIEVILLDNQRDGIEQITEALASFQNLDAVHLISHGKNGSVDIGNTQLDAETLNQNLMEISGWGDAFTEDGDFLIYGCNLAATEDGQSLVQSLSSLTHTDVAASDDLTGQAELGGDWELEFNAGTIESTVAISAETQQSWGSLLAETIYTSVETNTNKFELKDTDPAGQTFKYSSGNGTYNVNRLSLFLYEKSASTQAINVSLRDSWNGTILGSDTLSSDSLGTSFGWYDFDFSGVSLTDGASYVIQIEVTGTGGVFFGIDDSNDYLDGSKLNKTGDVDSGKEVNFRVSRSNTNTAPALTATPNSTVYTAGTAPVDLFNDVTIDTIEASQTIEELVLTVEGVKNGADERINFDGTSIALINGSGATASYNYSISLSGEIATVTLTTTGASVANAETLVDSLTYQHSNSGLTIGDRVIILSSITDSGGNPDTTALFVASTITVVANNAPTDLITSGVLNFGNNWTEISVSTLSLANSAINPEFTIEMEINPARVKADGWSYTLISQYNDANSDGKEWNDNGFYLSVNDGQLDYSQFDNTVQQGEARGSGNELTTDSWQTVTVTRDSGGTVVVYLDGIQVATGEISAIVNSAGNLEFLSGFEGDVREIRVFDSAFTGAEVVASQTANYTGSESGMLLLYDFEEGSGATLQDKTGNNYKGTLAVPSSTNWVAIQSVAENSVAGTVVGFLSADDPDAGDTLTYAISVDHPSNNFEIVGREIQVKAGASLDYESASSHTVTIRVTDSGGLTYEENVTINVTDVNEAPLATNDHPVLTFDGVDDIVTIADHSSLQMTNTLTMEAWVKPSADTYQIIVNKEGEYEFSVKDGNLQWGFYNTDPGWRWHDTGYATTADEWIHVAITYDNAIIKTYANGTLVDTYNGSGSIGDLHPGLNDLLIGGRLEVPATKYFDGQIADVRIWETVRSQAEISNNQNQVLTGAEAGLVGYWRLDEATGTAVADSSSESNNGTLGGGVLSQEPTWMGYTIDEDNTLTVTAPGLLQNDSDPDGDALTVNTAPVADASNGTLVLNADGSFTYTPNANFSGVDGFSYEILDGNGGTDTATVNIIINSVDDIPTLDLDEDNSSGSGDADYATIFTEGEAAVNIADSDAVLSDVDGTHFDLLTVTLTNVLDGPLGTDERFSYSILGTPDIAAAQSWPGNGTVVLKLTGRDTIENYQNVLRTITYHNVSQTPDTTDRIITIVANDGIADTNVGTANVAVNAVNDAPASTDKTVSTNEDTDYIFIIADFGFSDIESDAFLNVIIASAPTNGLLYLDVNGDGIVDAGEALIAGSVVSVTDITAGKLKFQPVADGNGTGYDSFTFQVQDDGGTANSGADTDQSANTIAIDVTAINDAPINNVPGAQAVNEDTSLVFNNNLISITDVDAGSTLRITLTSTNGLVTLTPMPVGDLNFIVGDGIADTNMTFEGSLADINAALDGLSFIGDKDFNGTANIQITTDDLTLITLNEDVNQKGYYTFNNAGALGKDDSVGGANDIVNGVSTTNDAIHGDVLSLDGNDDVKIEGLFGSPTEVTLAGWINLDSDFSDNYVISLGDSVGIVADEGDNGVSGFFYDGSSWKSTPSNQSIAGTGWHHVAYTFSDSGNVQTLYIDGIEMGSTNFAGSPSYSQGTDSYIGRHGNAAVGYFNGKIDDARIYDRALAASEIETFAYGQVTTDTDNIAITVNPVNDIPTLSNFSAVVETADEDTEIEVTLAELKAQGNEADIDGTVDGFIVQAVSSGTLKIGVDAASAMAWVSGSNDTVDATRHAYWTPASNETGILNAFTVVAEDDLGGLSVGAVQVTVSASPVGDTPSVTDISTDEDTQSGLIKISKHTGDGAEVTHFKITGISNGTLSLSDGTAVNNNAFITVAQGAAGLKFTPTTNSVADGSFEVEASEDGNSVAAQSGKATSTITIISVNDAPTVANIIPNQSAVEDVAFSFTFDASVFNDIDGDSLAYTSDASGWLSFDPDTRTFSGTPLNAHVGTTTVSVTANDGHGGTVTDSFDIVISNANDVAIIAGVDTGIVQEDVSVLNNNISTSGLLTISDDDIGEAVFVAETIAGSYGDLVMQADGNWIYTANNAQTSIQQLGLGESITETLTVSSVDNTTHHVVITINGTDDISVIGGTITGSVTEDGVLTSTAFLTITDTDSSDSTLFADIAAQAGDNGYGTFSITANTWTFTLDNNHAIVQTLDSGEIITDTYTFTASDGETQQVTVTINGAEDTPVFNSTPITTATESDTYRQVISVSDVDDEAVSIMASKLPNWLSLIDSGNGTAILTGTPGNAEVGDHSVVLSASDGTVSASQSFTIVVASNRDDDLGLSHFIEEPGLSSTATINGTREGTELVSSTLGLSVVDDRQVGEVEVLQSKKIHAISQLFEDANGANNVEEDEGVEDRIKLLDDSSYLKVEENVEKWKKSQLLILNEIDLQLDREDDLFELSEIKANEDLWDNINLMREQMNADTKQLEKQDFEIEFVAVTTIGITAGFVNWVLRGGALLSSLLSSASLFKQFDPLAVVFTQNKAFEKTAKTDSADNESDVEKLFDKSNEI